MINFCYTIIQAAFLGVACFHFNSTPSATVEVRNSCSMDRENELVEVNLVPINKKLKLSELRQLTITNQNGEQIPYQYSADKKTILFPATVAKKSKSTYKFSIGEPTKFKSVVFGKAYPERLDDFAWENEYAAYRIYGPELQRQRQRAYGVDVWTKCVDTLVVDQRYANEIVCARRADSLRAQGKKDEAWRVYQASSYHHDHGTGMDCYNVGPTLGGGTAGLYIDNKIVYPYCYKTCQIIENGPLRMVAQLDFDTVYVEGKPIVEHRIISCEKGSILNKCQVYYTGLDQKTPIVTGIVVHRENVDTLVTDNKNKFIAYADLTDNIRNNNGIIYLGAYCPELTSARSEWFSDEESRKERGNAKGHVLAEGMYHPGEIYTYYYGSNWSKGCIHSMEQWTQYLEAFAQRVQNPLTVKIK